MTFKRVRSVVKPTDIEAYWERRKRAEMIIVRNAELDTREADGLYEPPVTERDILEQVKTYMFQEFRCPPEPSRWEEYEPD